jgi:hypothetical protein
MFADARLALVSLWHFSAVPTYESQAFQFLNRASAPQLDQAIADGNVYSFGG